MALPNLLMAYITWHYTLALPHIYTVWRDFLWYVIHIFSLPLLTRTLFVPWKRMDEAYTGGGIEAWFEAKAISILARFFGFLMRLPIIFIGCLLVVLMVIGLGVFYVMWLAAPLVIFSLGFFGLILLSYV